MRPCPRLHVCARSFSSTALHRCAQYPDISHTTASYNHYLKCIYNHSDRLSAGKFAQRALAETLHLEVQRHSGLISTYSAQCVFAHNFITPSFIEEQKRKPDLTKRLEGTQGDLKTLEKNFPYAEKIAPEIVDAIATGDYAVLDGRFEPQLCWAVSRASSPKRGWGIWDTLLGIFAAIVFPFERARWERECRGDALKKRE